MKNSLKKTLLTLVAFLLPLLCGCNGAPAGTAETTEKPGTPTETISTQHPTETFFRYLTAQNCLSDRERGEVSEAFKTAYASFALKLLTSCEADNGDTAMVSPLSVMTALAMTANGAKGKTLTQMLNTLGGLPLDELNQQIFNYTSSLSSEENAFFRAANSVWVTNRPDFTVGQDFLHTIENTFEADVMSIDFSQSERAADAINGWCNEMTNGMIPKVVQPDLLNEDTIMTLLNALCFEAKWIDPFGDEQCYDGTFHGKDGDKTVTMMSGEANKYVSGQNETGFLRYYRGGQYAFLALLPNEGISTAEYLSKLDGETLVSLIGSAEWEDVRIRMPKFSADYDVELNDILKALGMQLPFDKYDSDLSGLGVMDDESNLYISNVIHKTHIDVDNEGTKAAAVTAVIIARATGLPSEPPHTVILDRPFVYAIVDTASGLPIFFGTCENA